MESVPLLSSRALRRGLLRSLLLGLPLAGWVLFLSLDPLVSGRLAVPLGSALGALALGFVQLPPAILEDWLTRTQPHRGERALLAGLLSWIAAAVGIAAASLQTDYAQCALSGGPDEARQLVLRVLASPAGRRELIELGLSLALPFATVAFSRVREAGQPAPGVSQQAVILHHGGAALLGSVFLLVGPGLHPCAASALAPVIWVASLVGAITYDVLDFLEVTWFPLETTSEDA